MRKLVVRSYDDKNGPMAWILIGLGSACAFGIAMAATWSNNRPRTFHEEIVRNRHEAESGQRDRDRF